MSNIKIFYDMKVTDNKTGKVVRRIRKRLAKSFVKAFLQVLEVQLSGIAVSIKDQAGASKSTTNHENNFSAYASAGNAAYGVLVGTGSTPVTLADYVMETLIAHGVGAGQLSYGASSKTTTAISGTDVNYIMTRTFNNGSGNTINVTELGVYCMIYSSGTFYAMLFHEVFSAEAVNNGQTLTTNITITTAL